MDINSIKQSIEKVARTAVTKSSDLVEVTKLRLSVSDAESEINRLMREIGKTLYESYKNNTEPEEDIADMCSMIDAKYAEIDEKNSRIMEYKNMTNCPNCGNAVAKDAEYCSKCGEKVK